MSATDITTHPATEETIEGLLDEYNSLKREILQTQGQRMQILSFTIGTTGVILSIVGGVVLGSENITPNRQFLVSIGGAIALYSILVPSLIMMITTQQMIRRLELYSYLH